MPPGRRGLSMTDRNLVAFLVTLHGNVQGIGLRKRIQQAAKERGITGWVRNRNSGHVQAHLEGTSEAIWELLSTLQPNNVETEIEAVVTSKSEAFGYDDFWVAAKGDIPKIQHSLLNGLHHRVMLLAQEEQDAELLLREVLKHKAAGQESDITEIARVLPSRYLGEPFVQRQKTLPFQLRDVVCSFSSESWSQKIANRAMDQFGIKSPEGILDDKQRGLRFSRAIGLKTPELYQNNVPLADVDLRPGIVIKPVRAASSKGVYSILSESHIVSLENNKVFASFDDLRKDAQGIPERLGRPDSWMVEELIFGTDDELPNDLKMLTFYGKVALVQEATRMPTRLCYYDRGGKKVSTGRYEDRLFPGTGLTPDYIELAEEVSLKVPIPFMRIDFLKSVNGPVFGEFTPKPGNFQPTFPK